MAFIINEAAEGKASNWKSELGRNGYILCDKTDCHMGFLSLKGMEAHVQVCTGIAKVGDFVPCPVCHVRFKTFLIMERHKERCVMRDCPEMQSSIVMDSAVHLPSPSIRTYERSSLAKDLKLLNMPTVVNNIFDDVDHDRIETAEDLRQRIMVESRRISTVRKPGRPPKCSYSKQQVTQVKTSDGKIISISAGSSTNLLRPPLLSRYNTSSPVIGIASHSSSFVDDRPGSRLSDFSMISSATPMKQSADDSADNREKELAMMEAQLREYQDRVLRYERLAEDATRVALQEKEHKLKRLADNLCHREEMAKKKLASAVHILEVCKTEPTSSPMFQQPPLVMPSVGHPLTESQPLPHQECPDTFTIDDEAEDEMPVSEENTPISRSAGVKYILPSKEDQPNEADEQSVTPITTADATEHHNNIIAVQHADVSQHNNIIVINDGDKGSAPLASFLSQTQHGEVTLVAQASEDGQYILVEAPIEQQTTIAVESFSAAHKDIEEDTNNYELVESLPVEMVQAVESPHAKSVELPPLSGPKVEMILNDEVTQSESIDETVQVEEQPIEIATQSSSAIHEEEVSPVMTNPEPLDEVNLDRIKMAEDLPQRIMVESKRISTVRKPGRQPKRKLAPEDIKSEPKQVAKRRRSSGNDQVPVRRSSRRNTIEMSQQQEQPLLTEAPVDQLITQVEDAPSKVVVQVVKPVRRGRKPKVEKIETTCEKAEPDDVPEKEVPMKRQVRGRRPQVKIELQLQNEDAPLRKRGRPSKKTGKNEEKEQQQQQPPPEANSVAVEPPCSQSKKTTAIDCGKCDGTFNNVKDFQRHVVSSHGGIARPKGEDQAMTEAEIMLALHTAFTLSNKVICFKCNQKSFTTLLRIKNHLKTCTEDTTAIVCGKCEETFKLFKDFQKHAVSSHGGIARPKGEDQAMTEAEVMLALQTAFTLSKKVICFKCNQKSFTTLMGIKYHLKTCSRSKDELEVMHF
jgi:uncharacterized C2H2 Zn-finger protein